MPFKKINLLVGIASAGALLFSGCEFGNKSTTELHGYDTISGYYESLPQSVVFHAKIGSGAERNQSGTVNQMPDFMKAVMGNPTMLYFDDPIGGQGSIRAHSNATLGFPTLIDDKLGTFGVSTSGYADVSGCRFTEETIHTGRFSQSPTTKVISGLTVRGQIAVDFTAIYSFVGEDVDCDVLRGIFKTCYSDNVGCSTDPGSILYRGYVTKVFGALIGAGVMTEAEIPSTHSVGFRAIYE